MPTPRRYFSLADEYERQRQLDLGNDPDANNTSLVDTAGRNIAGARVINRMLEGLRLGGPGTRTIHDNAEMNDAVSLRTGSGSVYDDRANGGAHYFVTPGMSRPMKTPGLIRAENERRRQFRVEQYGFDPYSTPEEQAQQIGEGIQRERSLQDSATASARRRLGYAMMNRTALERRKEPSQGGFIDYGGNTYVSGKTSPTRLPKFSLEDELSPEAYVGARDQFSSVAPDFRQEMDPGGASGSWDEPATARTITPLETDSAASPPARATLNSAQSPYYSPASTVRDFGQQAATIGRSIARRFGGPNFSARTPEVDAEEARINAILEERRRRQQAQAATRGDFGARP